MDAAARTLAANGAPVRPVTAARNAENCLDIIAASSGAHTHAAERRADADRQAGRRGRSDLQSATVETIRSACEEMDDIYGPGGGTCGVIVREKRVREIRDVLDSDPALAQWTRDTAGHDASARIQLVDAVYAKGLEYDHVIMVAPLEILDEGPGNLYVAMTRPTRKLHIVYDRGLPRGLAMPKS